jgi:GH24 family phage-related lysozyme (muramidase)
MHESAAKIFPKFSEGFEGRVLYPYLDQDGLVTVGIGCLVDPVELMFSLPWTLLGAGAPSHAEVLRQWSYLKAQTRLAKIGAKYAQGATTLRLTDADVDALLVSRMTQNEAELIRYFPRFATFPGDAQLGIHSMAWAMGAGFPKEFPHFTRAAISGDWATAKAECQIAGEKQNRGLVPRNLADHMCFENASRVIANPGALRVTETYWPLELT